MTDHSPIVAGTAYTDPGVFSCPVGAPQLDPGTPRPAAVAPGSET